MEKSDEPIPDPTTSTDLSSEAALLYTELLSMGFEESMCREAVKLTTNKDQAIELILTFQETLPQEQGAPSQQSNATTQETKIPVKIPKDSCKMVILARTDLKMGVGTIATQVCHAALGAYQNVVSSNNARWLEDLAKWEKRGVAKIVLKVKSKEELEELYARAKDAGLPTCLVTDAGNLTVCAIGPANSAEIDKLTGHLKLM